MSAPVRIQGVVAVDTATIADPDLRATLPGACVAGDLIVVALALAFDDSTFTVDWPAEYEEDVRSDPPAGGVPSSMIAHATAAGGETTLIIPITLTGSVAAVVSVNVYRGDGADAWSALVAAPELTDTAASAPLPGLTPPAGEQGVMFAYAAIRPNYDPAWPAPWTARTSDIGGWDRETCETADQLVADTLGDPFDGTLTGGGPETLWVTYQVWYTDGSSTPVTPPETPPYEAPDVPNAILEIWVADAGADVWDVALWDTAVWSGAGWQSITPWAINADVQFGATRAEAGILHDQEPAIWVVETHDPERVLDPSNPDSPFYPELVPGLPIRLSAAGRVIRTGRVDRLWYRHAVGGGRITATDAISRLANVRVPEDTILSDTLRSRAIEAIEAAGLDVDASWPIFGGDPDLSPAPSGDFSAWAVIARASREALHVPYLDKDDRLRWRRWSTPLRRGASVASPELVDLTTWTADEALYSVVRVQPVGGGAMIERRATPLPRYGERVHERTDETIHAGSWADAVLADRRDQSLRYVPGDIRPIDAPSVDRLARLQIMEDITLSYPEADPPVEVRARILGLRVRAEDETRETGEVRTRWRWRLITTLVAAEPLVEDGSDPIEFLVSDQDPTQYLYPDGVTAL